ncbi:hypothetical protein [Leptolyngbya iicbica]|uniref:Uncharacterized protein n=2 Tax=Cyanophyceae TaxID=3028117 RepID=A0A4Q7EH52_9CYAN|nr:hypothetical protein [Leptolyngbya sp. LK]RZM82328.1 hypothetical protein DYY88_03510 [Leptolyngbya sp. LK]
MQPIESQVTLLTQKVDALHQLIDQVNYRVTEILSSSQSHSAAGVLLDDHSAASTPSTGHIHRGEALLMHKDILMDSVYLETDRTGEESTLSPEIQIQRLTAQLTAAYNRIATLEEQLLASRAHY